MNKYKTTLIYIVGKINVKYVSIKILYLFIVHLQIWGCANTGNVLLTSSVCLDDEVAILFK